MAIELKTLEKIQQFLVDSGYRNNPVYNFNKSLNGFTEEYITQMHLLSNTSGFKIWAFQVEELRAEWMNHVVHKLYNRNPLDRNLLIFYCNNEDEKVFLHYHIDENSKLKIRRLFVDPSRFTATNEQILKEIKINVAVDENEEDIFERHIKAFDLEKVTQGFFDEFKNQVEKIKSSIKGLKSEEDRESYAVLLLSRTIFLYFIQKKGWLNGHRRYLYDRFLYCINRKKEINYYDNVLKPLFFQCLNTSEANRTVESKRLYENFETYIDTNINIKFAGIPYLNGGLFKPHDQYEKESNIRIDNKAFKELFDNLLEKYNFTVREDLGLDADIAVDPELLGRIYENMINLKERKTTGSFYTPRPIIDYMCKESLREHLYSHCKIVTKNKIDTLIDGLDRSITDENNLTRQEVDELKIIIGNIKICDPAVGSGAFILGMLQLIVSLLRKINKNLDVYKTKKQIICNNLYGVDIQEGAVEIAQLRLWLSLAVEYNASSIQEIEPLPNLKYKIMQGNSLISKFADVDFDSYINNFQKYNQVNLFNFSVYKKEIGEIIAYKKCYFDAVENKSLIEENIYSLEKDLLSKLLTIIGKGVSLEVILSNHRRQHFSWCINFPEIFINSENKGFDIIIGNPPYVNTKDTKGLTYEEMLKETYNFSDDLYNHFVFKSIALLKKRGILTFITSNTFLTIQSKCNMRKLLQDREIKTIIDMPRAFKALVDTEVYIVKNSINVDNYTIKYLDATQLELNDIYNLAKSPKLKSFDIDVKVYRSNLINVIFCPNNVNTQIYKKYVPGLKELYYTYWDKIKTSKAIEKNNFLISKYRSSLKPGDLTLLGIITEGGVGLQTGDNGKYVGVIEGSKLADKLIDKRIEKFYKALISNSENRTKLDKIIPEFRSVYTKEQVLDVFKMKSEIEIREIFEEIKEKTNKDIFGRGFIYRIISKDEVYDVERLTEDEKMRGIDNKRNVYVPYDKGDKDGNRWHLETPYYINWSKKSVYSLQSSKESRWQGYDYFFRVGFCWTDVNSVYLKARIKGKSIHDVLSMSLFNMLDERIISEKYIIAIINSKLIGEFVQAFLNNTPHFQINDARKMPIIIPNKQGLNYINKLVEDAIKIKREQFNGEIDTASAIIALDDIQKKIDAYVYQLYGINP